MAIRRELPDCHHRLAPTLIRPCSATPSHTLYLSNLDDCMFIRFSVKYLFLFRVSPEVESMKSSLSAVLNHYYPLSGRLRQSRESEKKLELECTAEGALFVEAFMDTTADEFQQFPGLLGSSWRKLHHEVGDQPFISVPPLVVQVTHLRCGGLILCASIAHCLCDGIGSSQFLNAWADACRDPTSPLLVPPCWGREALKPRNPPRIEFSHGTELAQQEAGSGGAAMAGEPLIHVWVTFEAEEISRLKRRCIPALNCTSFEVLAAHIWRCWARAMFGAEATNGRPKKEGQVVGLFFPADVRGKLDPPLPVGFYGNSLSLASMGRHCGVLLTEQIHQTVKGIQRAKDMALSDAYARSEIDLLALHQPVDNPTSILIVSQWYRLGLERVDFGSGPPVLLSGSTVDHYCLLLPVLGKPKAMAIQVSVRESMADALECYLRELEDAQGDEKPLPDVAVV
ncbi:alcohol acyltransferase 9-like [Nymphaea colorata]|nr:alcohol acyltransferase 9-like [Nymphaea colorata]